MLSNLQLECHLVNELTLYNEHSAYNQLYCVCIRDDIKYNNTTKLIKHKITNIFRKLPPFLTQHISCPLIE